MAQLKLKQVSSNLSYTSGSLIISSSGNIPAMVVSGSTIITSTLTSTGSLTIQNVDTFGDSGSFFTLDLGDF
jgi:hypothetical protein